MNTHKNARLTFHGRALLVRRVLEHGQRPVEVAQAMGVSPRTVYKWLSRYRDEGWEGLYGRSSRPARCPHRLPQGSPAADRGAATSAPDLSCDQARGSVSRRRPWLAALRPGHIASRQALCSPNTRSVMSVS